MERPKHRVLSREEEAKISRSKKKVKDVHHGGFKVGNSEGGSSRWHQEAWGLPKKSFKDKLVGEIPGAFAKAFDFTDIMEEEAESDDELLDLREGLVAVKLSKETKMRIRSPWALMLIIKPFGKAVGFSFLQNKLNLLWKPSGRIDLVRLGYGFYSVRFTLKEDLNAVLEKGPWFIGGHFLAIRPWEPLFKPAIANVNSIAVWVRLHGLPMELYETEVLKQIGDSIGRVLRIDSHTAMEERGEYALQIDINKPLINMVLIGRFEQPVTYEGIHSLCFSCGRVGHRKEVCLYTITNQKPPEGGAGDERENQAVNPHAMHATDSTKVGTDVSDGSGVDMNNESEANRAVPKGVTRSGPECIKRVEANGPFVVGRETSAGHKRGVVLNEARSSSSVKGKKELARNRASKWVSKSEFAASNRGKLGLQSQADDGSGCGRLGGGASVKEDQSGDGD
nr:uncharacterized protein CFP56_76991 [Quercus suber]